MSDQPRLLCPEEAVDHPFGALDPDIAQSVAREVVGRGPIDLCLLPSGDRRKKLLIADMDSTIITVECIDEIADFVGAKTRVAAITESAMRGEIPFEGALRERVALLKGLPLETLFQVYRERISLTPGARTLVQTMARDGAITALVSGGFTFFAELVAQDCGFAINRANQLLTADGKLTGEVAEPILGREAKLQSLIELREAGCLGAEDTLAVGDGANDLAMIKQAGLGVAFHAKPLVSAEARIVINHGDLTALLYLQGYQSSEFATA